MPILFTQESPAMGVWKITETWQDMLEYFKDNDNYSYDIQKIQSDKRKQEWLAVRLLLKYLHGPDVYISYLENGTPVLQNSKYSISISHTKGFAAVILSKSKNPGIDIEYLSGRAWKLHEKYLGENELKMFDFLQDSRYREKLATICWCAKETAFKALQHNEVDFINHLQIFFF